MTNLRRGISLALAAIALVGLNACDDDPTGTASDDQVILTSVSPPGGAVNVDPGSPVVIEFDHPMAEGMEAYCILHDGGLNGPEVPGNWEWSHDHQRLIFTPDQPFEHAHEYMVHLGGGMQDGHGHHTDFERHGHGLGGEWVEEHMFGAGGGAMGGHHRTGDGWQHHNGMYGMTFSFTTAP